jgi:hypothetical protein
MIALRFDQRLVRPKKYIGEIAMPSPAAELNNRSQFQTGFNHGGPKAIRP